MRQGGRLLSMALARAAEDGPEREPAQLLDLLRTRASPLKSLADPNAGNEAYTALQQDCPHVWNASHLMGSPADEAVSQTADLIRWWMRQARAWSPGDESETMAAALIVTSNVCARGAGLWSAMAAQGAVNLALAEFFQHLIAACRFNVGQRGPGAPPIWESELAQAFVQAERDQDWVQLARLWPRFEDTLWPDSLLTPAVQGLAAFAPDRFVTVLDGVDQIVAAMTIVQALPQKAIAARSDNRFVLFALVHQTGKRSYGGGDLDAELDMALESVVARVAAEDSLWPAWMIAFNQYPVRYLRLQPALGRALARAPEAALEPYVAALDLRASPSDEGPGPVSLALEAFRAEAHLSRRQRLWSLAHARWRDWNFGENDPHAGITQISGSDLDDAVVGYGVECLGEARLGEALTEILGQLQRLDETWHPTLTDYRRAWTRLVSTLQPLAHARRVLAEGADWCGRDRQYLPFDETDRYQALKSLTDLTPEDGPPRRALRVRP